MNSHVIAQILKLICSKRPQQVSQCGYKLFWLPQHMFKVQYFLAYQY